MNLLIFYISLYWLYCGFIETTNNWNPKVDECPPWEMKCEPTIIDVPNFNPITDSDDLYNAQKDDKFEPLIDILCRRSIEQRHRIFQVYRNRWGSDLVKILQIKLAYENNRRIVKALTKSPVQFYRDELLAAMSMGFPADRHLNILDILGGLSNKGNVAIAASFNNVTNHLHKRAEVRGNFLDFLHTLAMGRKAEGTSIDTIQIQKDLHLLQMAEGSDKTDFLVYKHIVLNRNNVYLRTLYKEFVRVSNHSIRNSLAKGWFFSDEDVRASLMEYYKLTFNRAIYFADRLYDSFDRIFWIDYDTIRRIIVGRAEIDLENIKTVYLIRYKRNLTDAVKKHTSGLYRYTLLKLLEKAAEVPSKPAVSGESSTPIQQPKVDNSEKACLIKQPEPINDPGKKTSREISIEIRFKNKRFVTFDPIDENEPEEDSTASNNEKNFEEKPQTKQLKKVTFNDSANNQIDLDISKGTVADTIKKLNLKSVSFKKRSD